MRGAGAGAAGQQVAELGRAEIDDAGNVNLTEAKTARLVSAGRPDGYQQLDAAKTRSAWKSLEISWE